MNVEFIFYKTPKFRLQVISYMTIFLNRIFSK